MDLYILTNGCRHKIVCIVYHDGTPHSVTAIEEKYSRPYHWDFDLHHEWQELMYYNSGSGGSEKTISGEQYIEGANGVTYWIHKSMRVSKKYPFKNCTRIPQPLQLIGDRTTPTFNPFEVGSEVGTINYCDECKGHYNEDHCSTHVEWNDDKGDFVYKSTGEIVE